jgi:hypothetical protein
MLRTPATKNRVPDPPLETTKGERQSVHCVLAQLLNGIWLPSTNHEFNRLFHRVLRVCVAVPAETVGVGITLLPPRTPDTESASS